MKDQRRPSAPAPISGWRMALLGGSWSVDCWWQGVRPRRCNSGGSVSGCPTRGKARPGGRPETRQLSRVQPSREPLDVCLREGAQAESFPQRVAFKTPRVCSVLADVHYQHHRATKLFGCSMKP